MDNEKKKLIPVIRKVTHVEVTPQGRTERELTGDELEQWKKEHGYVDAENKTESDTDRETDSDTRESE